MCPRNFITFRCILHLLLRHFKLTHLYKKKVLRDSFWDRDCILPPSSVSIRANGSWISNTWSCTELMDLLFRTARGMTEQIMSYSLPCPLSCISNNMLCVLSCLKRPVQHGTSKCLNMVRRLLKDVGQMSPFLLQQCSVEIWERAVVYASVLHALMWFFD